MTYPQPSKRNAENETYGNQLSAVLPPCQSAGDSLRRQGEIAERIAARVGCELSPLTYKDCGISAFHGDNAKANLGRILEAIENGNIPKGSYLIVEKLDRLSREDELAGWDLFKRIIKAGVRIATEHDTYDETSLRGYNLLKPILDFIAANEYSRKLSERVGPAWADKKRNAAKEKVTASGPEWLDFVPGAGANEREQLRKGKFVPNEKAATVKFLFTLADKGMGLQAIVRKMKDEGREPAGRSKTWYVSTVATLLRNPAVIGYYQPHVGHHKKRVPVGEPIKGYYPAVVPEPLFYRVQAALDNRRTHRGRRGNGQTNIFTGLLHHKSGTIRIKMHHGKRVLVPVECFAGNEPVLLLPVRTV